MKPYSIFNKKASFDYDIKNRIVAGLKLTGHETKSIKMGHCNMLGARAIIRNNEAFIVGLDIPSFQKGNEPSDYDPLRTKKLLLNKSEISRITGELEDGYSLIPIKIFSQKNYLKMELGLGRRKKKHDKRETVKKRESDREIRRKMKKSGQ